MKGEVKLELVELDALRDIKTKYDALIMGKGVEEISYTGWNEITETQSDFNIIIKKEAVEKIKKQYYLEKETIFNSNKEKLKQKDITIDNLYTDISLKKELIKTLKEEANNINKNEEKNDTSALIIGVITGIIGYELGCFLLGFIMGLFN